MNLFTMPNFKNDTFGKKFSDGALSLYRGYSGKSSDCSMAFPTNHLLDRTFGGSN